MSSDKHNNFFYKIEWSALATIIGIIILFSGSVIVILIAPNYVEKTWTEPSSAYQVQMYEVSDPNFYISGAAMGGNDIQYVQHVKNDFTLLAFQESSTVRILAPTDLEKYVTRINENNLKLTTRLLLLRRPTDIAASEKWEKDQREKWEKEHPKWKEEGITPLTYVVWELYDPHVKEAFVLGQTDGILENWVDKNFSILEEPKEEYQKLLGVIYVNNPIEYRYRIVNFENEKRWFYDPQGNNIQSIQELTSKPLSFTSRKELIEEGEHIYAIEGCWYCHTDQTRTLVQDVVLNGGDSFPAPPSSPNEYIYQKITFPGTKRNGPDISRVGVKKPSRDWHKAHFWAPKTQSLGSIMPSFRHFFDYDPRGTSPAAPGVPNRKFEAIFQYLMTKGTRITPPTQAWWLGLDPVNTIDIIEGKRVIK